MARLIAIRHAQASFGKANYDLLSPKGEEQSAVLGEYLASGAIPFDCIISGDLKRHHQTKDISLAEVRKAGLEIPEIHIDPNFNEHEITALMKEVIPRRIAEGKIPADILVRGKASQKDYFEYFRQISIEWTEGTLEHSPEIETWAKFRARVKEGLDKILAGEYAGKNILLYTSGGVISTLVAESLGLSDAKIMELNLIIQNTSISEFLFSGGRFNLQRMNTIHHIKKPAHLTYI